MFDDGKDKVLETMLVFVRLSTQFDTVLYIFLSLPVTTNNTINFRNIILNLYRPPLDWKQEEMSS